MQYKIGKDRNQFQIIALEQLVPDNSWARVIDRFVDLLPLVELEFKHSILRKDGRPPSFITIAYFRKENSKAFTALETTLHRKK